MFSALLLCAAGLAAPGPWRTYEVYQPRIERHFVVNADTGELKYNHDSSIAWFRDRWFCIWNANQPPAEGKPGQLNYISTSRDGRTWTPPEPAFSSEARSANPIPCPTGFQWQPNLIVVRDELWAVWSQNSKDEHFGCYVSRLSHPDGRWRNRLLKWDGNVRPEVDGKRWRLFPSQNPIRLRSGRILAPVTMIGPPAADAPPLEKAWLMNEKRNSVLYTDDEGETWHISPGAVHPARTWAQWEPTVWELRDGSVMMFARNNDFRGRAEDGPRPAEMLMWSRSTDGGATWTPHEYVPLETVCSRMHVLPAGGDRFAMVHSDWPADKFVSDRQNIALFFTRGAGIDFVAGPGLTGYEPVVAYPQMCIRGDTMLVSYSQGNQPRSIKVAHVSPLPDPDRYYLFPRTNLPPPAAPERIGDAYRFFGGQHIATRAVIDPGEEAFSIGAWVWPRGGGVLLDTRRSNPNAGFVCGVRGGEHWLRPFIYLATPEHNIAPSIEFTPGQWNYVGFTVDNRAGSIVFHINAQSERVPFTAPAGQPLRGTTGHIGAKRFEGSRLTGLIGELRALALYRSTVFGVAEHNWLHNAFAASLDRPTRAPAAPPKGKPIVWLDPAGEPAFDRDFVLPQDDPGGVTVVEADGRQAVRFSGEASAGVDLDQNDRRRGDRVELTFRFRIESGDDHVLCTVGDANEPARLVAKSGELWLKAGDEQRSCGRLRTGDWNLVELLTQGEQTSARLNDGSRTRVQHEPVATWLYLGQGYRTGAIPGESRFLVDVPSVRSRVTQ